MHGRSRPLPVPAGNGQILPLRRTLAGRQVATYLSRMEFVVFAGVIIGCAVVAMFTSKSATAENDRTRMELQAFADANGLEFFPTPPEKPKTELYVLERGGSQRHTLYHLSRPGSKATVFDYWASTPASVGDHSKSGEYRSRKDVVAFNNGLSISSLSSGLK